ncbi:Hpr(Ser) kinase/phosphatase [Roseovarius azorensis]|uniref:Hpr(Ser) kinase/phosphatase n=1 Tax=Roseovarius azorensis TaxID=1287727 RepID=A0A1H7UBM3_9RHOB|nr:serine kinase [Roseovarius azorensis]SEL93687.1 Hpr(Ser) kinase/phosphatase [Roseovarius azorensis]
MPTPPLIRWARDLSWACRSEPVPGEAGTAEMVTHASCVAYGGRAVLIRGAPGRGKSGLALDLLAMGAGLVADDRTRLWRREDQVMADAPETIRGRIEARGVGILTLPGVGPQPLALIVDMDRDVAERLPPLDHEEVMGVTLPILGRAAHRHFPAAILLYLMHGELS